MEDSLSPLNKQAVAEQAILKFFRENGVFTPPKDSDLLSYGVSQEMRIDMLIHASVKFVLEKFRDPRRVQRLLLEEMKDLIY